MGWTRQIVRKGIVMRRIALGSIVAIALAGLLVSVSMAQALLYDTAGVTSALLGSRFTDEELLWAEAPVQGAATDGALYQVRVSWASGLLYYDIFPTEEQAAAIAGLGTPVTMDGAAGRTVWVIPTTNGYGGCSYDANVRICAVSVYGLTDYPGGAVILGVEAGMTHLWRVS